MPGVRSWPKGDDPRTACFCSVGFAAGKPAPWKFLVVVEDAVYPASVFNGEHVLTWSDDVNDDGEWCVWLKSWGPLTIRIDKKGGGVGPPSPDTVQWLITFTVDPNGPAFSEGQGWRDEFPEPDALWPEITPGDDDVRWPTPVVVRAVPHDFTV